MIGSQGRGHFDAEFARERFGHEEVGAARVHPGARLPHAAGRVRELDLDRHAVVVEGERHRGRRRLRAWGERGERQERGGGNDQPGSVVPHHQTPGHRR